MALKNDAKQNCFKGGMTSKTWSEARSLGSN